jgi:hypothetical protein
MGSSSTSPTNFVVIAARLMGKIGGYYAFSIIMGSWRSNSDHYHYRAAVLAAALHFSASDMTYASSGFWPSVPVVTTQPA